MKSTALVLVALSMFATAATAGPTADKKKRDAVDKELAAGAAEVKHCGKTIKFSFDWAAFDKIDWSKSEREKDHQIGSEISNVRYVGTGIDRLCEDKDYKEPLQKIDNVVYRTTLGGKDGDPWVTAKIQGSTLTFESRVGGSTRGIESFEDAAKKVL